MPNNVKKIRIKSEDVMMYIFTAHLPCPPSPSWRGGSAPRVRRGEEIIPLAIGVDLETKYFLYGNKLMS